jgi:hypothetical protein
MLESRSAAINRLMTEWGKKSAHYDDYRGILMCLKDLKAAMELTDVYPEVDIQRLVGRAKRFAADIKGKPWIPTPEAYEILELLLGVIEDFTQAGFEEQNKKLTKQIAELEKKLAGKKETVPA